MRSVVAESFVDGMRRVFRPRMKHSQCTSVDGRVSASDWMYRQWESKEIREIDGFASRNVELFEYVLRTVLQSRYV